MRGRCRFSRGIDPSPTIPGRRLGRQVNERPRQADSLGDASVRKDSVVRGTVSMIAGREARATNKNAPRW
jgi:hypothetical protein